MQLDLLRSIYKICFIAQISIKILYINLFVFLYGYKKKYFRESSFNEGFFYDSPFCYIFVQTIVFFKVHRAHCAECWGLGRVEIVFNETQIVDKVNISACDTRQTRAQHHHWSWHVSAAMRMRTTSRSLRPSRKVRNSSTSTQSLWKLRVSIVKPRSKKPKTLETLLTLGL